MEMQDLGTAEAFVKECLRKSIGKNSCAGLDGPEVNSVVPRFPPRLGGGGRIYQQGSEEVTAFLS